MKCISLWQPWASLMAIDAKRIETRDWRLPLDVSGQWVAIHAAQKWTAQLLTLCDTEPFRTLLHAAGFQGFIRYKRKMPRPLPLGAIVACVRFDSYESTEILRDGLTEQERAFGDYSAGRFAWYAGGLIRIDPPVELTGQRKFFDVPDELLPVLRKRGTRIR